MKLIETTQYLEEKDSLGKAVDRIKQLLQVNKSDNHAEDAIIAHFMRGLDNRFVMVRKLQLDRKGETFPPILIGPSGILLINICPVKGFFKAKEDTWWEMNRSTQRFGPGRPNLIKQTEDYAQKLGGILDARGKSHPRILPVLILANPGVHIESSNPSIRIVLMDGVDSLIDNILNSDEVLLATEISFLSDSLEIMSHPGKSVQQVEEEDFFGKDLFVTEKKAPSTSPDTTLRDESQLSTAGEKLVFTQKQWIILVVLLIATILVLVAAILYALRIF